MIHHELEGSPLGHGTLTLEHTIREFRVESLKVIFILLKLYNIRICKSNKANIIIKYVFYFNKNLRTVESTPSLYIVFPRRYEIIILLVTLFKTSQTLEYVSHLLLFTSLLKYIIIYKHILKEKVRYGSVIILILCMSNQSAFLNSYYIVDFPLN